MSYGLKFKLGVTIGGIYGVLGGTYIRDILQI